MNVASVHFHFLGSYNLRARVQPVLLVLLPLAPLVLMDFQLDLIVVRILMLYLAGMLIIQFGRDPGRKREVRLFEKWGGKPSVAMLRHRDGRLARHEKKRYRDYLERHVPGLQLASAEEEGKSPSRADEGYAQAISWLLTKTRNREEYPLIFEENVNYGFRRNIWAHRPSAFVSECLALAILVLHASAFWTGEIYSTLRNMPEIVWWCMLAVLLHAYVFAFVIREQWVRLQAERYARQLLSACQDIHASSDMMPGGD